MQRTIDIEVSLEGLRVQNKPLFCEGDKNTHFLKINFMNDLDLAGYTLQIYYLPPYPCVIPFVDLFSEVTNNPFIVPIPNKILERNGEVKVEFSLSKENNLITINKTFNFEVVRTINGTSLTAYPEGTLKETIAQQIEKIKKLLAESQNKIDEYNNNTVEKMNKFDENAQTKTNEFTSNFEEKLKVYNDNSDEKLKTYNDNDTLKTKNYNDNASSKTTEFNNNASKKLEVFNTKADEKATEAANTAALEANKLVVAQQTKSVKAVEDTGSTEISEIYKAGEGAIGAVGSAKDTAVSEGKKELDNYVTNTSKVELDNYVTEKESQIKGATYTPSISPNGDLSFTNDKGLHNPETVNLKGEKGDPGNFSFQVEDGHLVLYTVDNGAAPTFSLENGHLIMEIN